jgi:hypothetical protein
MKTLVVLFSLLIFFDSFSQSRQIIYPQTQMFQIPSDTIYNQIIWLGDDYDSHDYEYLFNHSYKTKYDIHLSTTEGHHLLFTDLNEDNKIDMIGNTKFFDSSEVGYAEYIPYSFPIFQIVSSFPDTNIFTETLVDLNNDDKNEVLTGSNYPLVNVYNNKVSFMRSLPVRGQWGNTKPLIADIDDNNMVDFIIDQNLSDDYTIRFFEYDYVNDTLNLVTKIDSMLYRWYTTNGDTVDTLVHVYGAFSDYVYGDLDDDGFIEVATGHHYGYLNIFEKNQNGYEQEYFDNMGTYNMYQIAITNDLNLNGKKELIVMGNYDGGPLYWLEADSSDNYSVIRKDFIDYGYNTSVLFMKMYAKDVDLDGKDELVFRGHSLIWILKWNPLDNKWDMFFYLRNREYDDNMWGNVHERSFPGTETNVEFYDIDKDGDNDMFISTDKGITLFFESNLSVLSVNNPTNFLPVEFNLSQNYPNPFNPVTTIKYSVPKTSHITLVIYDLLGREIKTLINEEKYSGNYTVKFDGTNLSSGVYFYVMKANNFVETKKLVLLK